MLRQLMQAKVSGLAIRAVLLTKTIIRIGEAQNPGPDHQPGLTIGAINPTGLLRKASSFSQLPAEPNAIWGVCETHLSSMGIRKFKTELKFADKNFALHHGAPAPFRSQAISAIGGTHVGTAFVSNLPSRKIQMHCSEEMWSQARCTINTFLCKNTWIHGAVVYGYSHKAYSTEVRRATDELLEIATKHVVHNLKGPRFILGDFNQEPGLLQQPQIWEKLGWHEAQVSQQTRFGTEIAKTCKQSTTKDFLWMSPELHQHFKFAEVVNHVYPDHGALLAHFSFIGHDTHMYQWRMPKPLPWDDCVGRIPEYHFDLPNNLTTEESSRLIAEEFEQRVHQHLVENAKPGLLPQQRGRCQTMESRKVQKHSKPIKASRHGHAQPEFQGHSLQHQRWFTQLRRMESLNRLFHARPWNENQLVHAHREWRAILKAPGFSDFRRWWNKLPNKLANAPANLPGSLPEQCTLTAICLTFHAEVRNLERVLQTELITKAKHNRVAHPNKVFKDFARPAVSPVCILQDTLKAQIMEVDPEDCSITLDSATAFWPGELIGSPGPFRPIVTCEDKMWLEHIDGFAPGQLVRQEKFVGQLEDLFQRFQDEWQSRWDRHLNTPESRWDPLFEFYKLAQEQGPEQMYHPITKERWLQSLKKKKTNAAQGPDGWTRKDLLMLPDDLTEAILSILHDVEAGVKQWPKQWLVGIVHSLEKYDQPESVAGYRPITIFSLIYRNWASIRSKEILHHLTPLLSSFSYGNIPRRSTTDMWLGLQQEIESNLANDQPTSGAVLDIVKCFNHLPRIPLFEVLRHLGVAPQLIRAWSSALSRIERRFAIRGSVGQALKSTTGFAEGCSLSIIAMVAANEIISKWMRCRAPKTQLISYVDNLELYSCDPHALLTSVQKLEEILELLDLQVDKKKTYLWSTDGSFRKLFIQHGHHVKTAARDIGAHIQYTRQATNFTITQKISLFSDRWKSLALSPAPYEQKLRAAKAVAWPNMLHGITSAHLGDPWYEDMRTGLVRALGEHKPGCSPLIHLSLVEHPSADPGYHAVWTSITQCRQYMTPEQCIPQWSKLAAATHRKRPEVGPCSVILHRLLKLHWTWDAAGFFRDAWGFPVHIWSSPIQELAYRVTESWRYRIACEVSTRHTFVGLAKCDAAFTTENLTKQNRDRAILRSALNGTFLTLIT